MDFSLTSFDDTSYQKGFMEGIKALKASLQEVCGNDDLSLSNLDQIVERTVHSQIHS